MRRHGVISIASLNVESESGGFFLALYFLLQCPINRRSMDQQAEDRAGFGVIGDEAITRLAILLLSFVQVILWLAHPNIRTPNTQHCHTLPYPYA